MDEMNDRIGAILNDPSMMQQIVSMAQSLGNSAAQEEEAPAQAVPDAALLQRVTAMARQTGIDSREQALLRALGAYLSKDRIGRLEKAMRAARIARVASGTLGQGGLLTPSGRSAHV